MTDFEKFALSRPGVSSSVLSDYMRSAYINPTITEERTRNVAQMDVFSRLMMDRQIFLGVPIDADVANIIVAQLLFLSADAPGDISIYINSPGGTVYDGLAIYDTMQMVGCDVATICTGMAASMGAVLLSAGTHGKRSALPHSRVMIHQPLGGTQGQATDIEIATRQILQLKNELYTILASHSGQSIDKIRQDAERDYWLTAAEAAEYGLIDNVIKSRK